MKAGGSAFPMSASGEGYFSWSKTLDKCFGAIRLRWNTYIMVNRHAKFQMKSFTKPPDTSVFLQPKGGNKRAPSGTITRSSGKVPRTWTNHPGRWRKRAPNGAVAEDGHQSNPVIQNITPLHEKSNGIVPHGRGFLSFVTYKTEEQTPNRNLKTSRQSRCWGYAGLLARSLTAF